MKANLKESTERNNNSIENQQKNRNMLKDSAIDWINLQIS